MSERKENPIPQGKYIPATRFGNLVFSAGMTARKDGVPIITGKVSVTESLETYHAAVRQACENALTSVRNRMADSEEIKVLTLTVYVNAEVGFVKHSALADFASEYLYECLGEKGIGARTAIGVASLPGDAPVEIQLICAAEKSIIDS